MVLYGISEMAGMLTLLSIKITELPWHSGNSWVIQGMYQSQKWGSPGDGTIVFQLQNSGKSALVEVSVQSQLHRPKNQKQLSLSLRSSSIY